MSEMEHKALEILARIAKRDASDLAPGQYLVADLSIDSPKALELLCDIEEECGFEIPDDAVNRLETVGDVIEMVNSFDRQAIA
ncbi:MAG: acyl carrier protein [bacterium]|nr:acyl carrier protein [bacterium]